MIAPNIHLRIIAIFCCAIGFFGFKFWQAEIEKPPTRFLIKPVPERDTARQGRDLSEYEFGGNIDDCFEKGEVAEWMDRETIREIRKKEKACPEIRERARRFILKNWKEKRKAYIVLDYYCTDCFPNDHVFIEPDRFGRWNIIFRRSIERSYPGFGHTMYDRVIVDVRWRLATTDDFAHKAGKPLLSFLDDNGDEVASL